MKHIQFYDIDFIASPKWRKTVLFVLMGLTVVLSVLAWRFYQTQQRLATLQETHQRHQTQQQHIAPPPVVLDSEQEQRMLKEYAALQALHQSLFNPLHVFGALEQCVSQDVMFLAVRPQRSSQDVNIQMEVRDIQYAKSALECLTDTGMFEQVRLLSQQRVLEDPQQPLRIDVLTRVQG